MGVETHDMVRPSRTFPSGQPMANFQGAHRSKRLGGVVLAPELSLAAMSYRRPCPSHLRYTTIDSQLVLPCVWCTWACCKEYSGTASLDAVRRVCRYAQAGRRLVLLVDGNEGPRCVHVPAGRRLWRFRRRAAAI